MSDYWRLVPEDDWIIGDILDELDEDLFVSVRNGNNLAPITEEEFFNLPVSVQTLKIDFEEGNLTDWTTTDLQGTGWTLAATTGSNRNSTYGMEAVAANTGNTSDRAQGVKDFSPWGTNKTYLDFDIQVNSMSAVGFAGALAKAAARLGNDAVNGSTDATQRGFSLRWVGLSQLRGAYKASDGTLVDMSTTVTLTTGQWYKVRMLLDKSGAQPVLTWWLSTDDGANWTQQDTATDTTTGTQGIGATINRAAVGVVHSGAFEPIAGTFWFDNVTVADGEVTYTAAGLSGTGASFLGRAETTASGVAVVSASASAALSQTTQDASGSVSTSGSGSTQLGQTTSTSSGAVGVSASGEAFTTPTSSSGVGSQVSEALATGEGYLGQATASASGSVAVSGVGNGSLGTLSGASQAQATVAGSGTGALSPTSASATGIVRVAGSASQNLGTSAASSSALAPASGSGTASLAASSTSGAGTVAVSGQASQSLVQTTVNADADVIVSGSGQGFASGLTASGTIGNPPRSATGDGHLGQTQVTASAAVTISGAGNAFLGTTLTASTAIAPISGVGQGQLGTTAISASGTVANAPASGTGTAYAGSSTATAGATTAIAGIGNAFLGGTTTAASASIPVSGSGQVSLSPVGSSGFGSFARELSITISTVLDNQALSTVLNVEVCAEILDTCGIMSIIGTDSLSVPIPQILVSKIENP